MCIFPVFIVFFKCLFNHMEILNFNIIVFIHLFGLLVLYYALGYKNIQRL
jgi:hypothetical protein